MGFFLYKKNWAEQFREIIGFFNIDIEEVSVVALNKKQKLALELLTNGEGLSYKEIAARVGVNPKTLWDWRKAPEFTQFQAELQRLNDERWFALVDAAREAAYRLVSNDNQKMVEFVLKNEGYNPTHKVEADITTDIIINIEGVDENE